MSSASDDSFHALFESFSEGMILTDQGMIVEINHLCARWLGRTPADLSGQQFTTLLAPGDQSVTLPLSTSDRQQVIELALQCVDGTTVPVDAYARPLPYNGRLLELITVHNISIRKHTEAALRANEAHVRALVQSAFDAIVILEVDGQVRYISPALERALGYPIAELIGQRPALIIALEDLPAVQQAFLTVLEQPGASTLVEFRVQHQDGSRRFFEGALTNLLQDPAVDGVVFNVRDITERKQAEADRLALLESEQAARHEAEAAVEARNQFISIAAHELRSPLMVASGQAEMLARHLTRQQPDLQRVATMLAKVRIQLARFGEMLSDLLDLSRLQHGQLSLQQTQVDLVPLVQRIVERFSLPDEQDMRHHFQLHLPESLVATVDGARLDQVLSNLIDNAIKYSPAGGTVTVTLHADPEAIIFQVADEGIGIAPAERERIFEAFTRTKAAANVAHGLGIGLYVTAQIVQAHGGTIDVQNTPTRGSTFTIRLPR